MGVVGCQFIICSDVERRSEPVERREDVGVDQRKAEENKGFLASVHEKVKTALGFGKKADVPQPGGSGDGGSVAQSQGAQDGGVALSFDWTDMSHWSSYISGKVSSLQAGMTSDPAKAAELHEQAGDHLAKAGLTDQSQASYQAAKKAHQDNIHTLRDQLQDPSGLKIDVVNAKRESLQKSADAVALTSDLGKKIKSSTGSSTESPSQGGFFDSVGRGRSDSVVEQQSSSNDDEEFAFNVPGVS